MKNQSFIKWVLLVVLLLAPIYGLFLIKNMIFNGEDKSKFPSLEVVSETPIPEFSFVNQDNEIVTNETYKGKIYIADFIFTTCPSICKEMTFHMEYLQGKLSRYDDILFLSHSINPEYDTPEVLKSYATQYEKKLGADLSTWNFVTGDKEEIYEIAKSYLCSAAESEEEDSGGYIHSGFFVLIDTEGKIRCGYDSNGNPIGAYDGTSVSSVKDLIVDVGVLVSETKRKARENEK
ncbi:MAG: SCO family protein [Flavobacteriales bacterium]